MNFQLIPSGFHTVSAASTMDFSGPPPLVTVAVPSFNQGQFLNDALQSIFQQNLPLEVFVADAGSSDDSVAIIQSWAPRLAGWRSYPDQGQAAAINECIARGSAPYVAWLNSDDVYLPNALHALVAALAADAALPAVYGRVWNVDASLTRIRPVWVQPFTERRLANRCIVSQPATLIRRSAWERVGGVNESLAMVMDYDLWWRLFRTFGPMGFVDTEAACNRDHAETKTNSQRRRHYQEAIATVRKYHGRVPIKWWLAWPYAVWVKSWLHTQRAPAGQAT